MQSEKYIGILRWGDIEIENGCPALIDRATFDKVQERIKQSKREGGKNKAKIEYLLTGKPLRLLRRNHYRGFRHGAAWG